MPYSLNNKPEFLNKLPKQAQRIFINAFNSSYEKNKNDEIATKTAWSAIKKAGFSKNKDGIWRRWN